MSKTRNYLFTSESVSEGHPDKICDQISDGVLDAIIAQDPDSRIALETMVKTGLVVLAGELTTKANVAYDEIARSIVKDIGYDRGEIGFDYKSFGFLSVVERQSPDISMGVTAGEGLHDGAGAGDQGMMFGYACDETPSCMPATIAYAHQLVSDLATMRKQGTVDFLRPDAKSQVTAEYEKGKLKRIDAVVLSTQHGEDVSHADLKAFIIDKVVKNTIPSQLIDENTKFHINPTGRFVIGGPQGDCGLTGRKIIVDTYGGHGAHGGGAFSGKDPSKVDRSAAYMGRYIAKNIVAAGAAERCLVQLAYAIGVPEPVSVFVDTYGTNKLPEEELEKRITANLDLTPDGIIKTLDLKRPIYRETARYGHFGRDGFPWENTDKVDVFRP